MNAVRILVGEMPQMLRNIIEHALSVEPDMELVTSGYTGDLSFAVKSADADVAIVAGDVTERSASHERLLLENPQLKLLVVSGDGRQAHLLEFRRIALDDLSPRNLVEAIRAAVAGTAKKKDLTGTSGTPRPARGARGVVAAPGRHHG